MSELDFVSPAEARAEDGFAPQAASPLARALDGAAEIRDLSSLGKLEVRGGGGVGELGADVETLAISPDRTLVLCPPERCAELRTSLPGLVVDVTGALAGIAVESAELMRRLTDLDLAALPAAGRFADVPALLSKAEDGFRIFFPQEYGHSVVDAVRDLQAGLA
jgi:hypothetical protein